MFRADCPYYLSMGMTFDQYWYGDVWLSKAFLEADRLRRKQRNTELWLQGMYCYDALCCALQNAFRGKGSPPAEYPREPYDIFPKKKTQEEIKDQEERERLQAEVYMRQMMWAGQHWGGS